jgi:hypothetical protein
MVSMGYRFLSVAHWFLGGISPHIAPAFGLKEKPGATAPGIPPWVSGVRLRMNADDPFCFTFLHIIGAVVIVGVAGIAAINHFLG